jgi:hypothetical protein
MRPESRLGLGGGGGGAGRGFNTFNAGKVACRNAALLSVLLT